MLKEIGEKFEFEPLGTNFTKEIVAGVSVYLSLAYIFIVNPAILSQAGIPSGAVFFATVLASAFATLAMGLFARLPFALAPGLEANGFFAFVVVGALGFSWQEGLGIVFWSGILCLFFTVIPIRQKIIDSIPNELKIGIAVTVGIFVATIGLVITDIIVFNNGVPSEIGSVYSKKAILLYVGLIVSAILGLRVFNFPAGMLVAIISCTVLGKLLGVPSDTPPAKTEEFLSALGQLELFGVFKNPNVWVVLLIFFMIDFYGSIGKFIGLTAATNLYSNGQVKNMKNALYVDGGGTVFGSLIGTSTIITYVESAVAIAAGGRTGIAAIVCALLMFLSLAFTPLIGFVPVAATAGILVYVGYLLLPITRIKDRHLKGFDILVLILMGMIALFTFSLDKSLLVGFLFYSVNQTVIQKGKFNESLVLLWISTLLLSVSMGFQYLSF